MNAIPTLRADLLIAKTRHQELERDGLEIKLNRCGREVEKVQSRKGQLRGSFRELLDGGAQASSGRSSELSQRQLSELMRHMKLLKEREVSLEKEKASLQEGIARLKVRSEKLEAYQDELRNRDKAEIQDAVDQDVMDARSLGVQESVAVGGGAVNLDNFCVEPSSSFKSTGEVSVGALSSLDNSSNRFFRFQEGVRGLVQAQGARLLSCSVAPKSTGPTLALEVRLSSGEPLGLRVSQGESGLRISLRSVPGLIKSASKQRIMEALQREGLTVDDVLLESV